ncbi:MAG TPA: YceI family protein [Caulobacteraceae bacterium]|nr:YceI family protein [Caulobacteraceae bacterium]
MRRLFLTLIVAWLAPGAALAAAQAAHWSVDPGSKLAFQGKMNGDTFNGTFRRWSADIRFDPKALAASKAVVTIDVASAATGDSDRDQALPGPDWFAAQRFPKATFTTTQIKDLGGGRYQALGDLAIRGAHKAVVLPFTLAISGDTARMNGQLVLNRTAFGIGQGKWSTPDVVATQVTVIVALTAHRTP